MNVRRIFQTEISPKNSLWASKMQNWQSCKKLFAWSPKSFARCPRKSENSIIPKIVLLKFILLIRRMPLWQLCWELLGKNLKLSLPKSINDSNYVFYAKSVPSEISSRHFPAEILRFFHWNSEKVELFFDKTFFGKMVVWTGKMPLCWELQHFSPESWKSSARIHKLMEKNAFKSKFFFLRKALLDT